MTMDTCDQTMVTIRLVSSTQVTYNTFAVETHTRDRSVHVSRRLMARSQHPLVTRPLTRVNPCHPPQGPKYEKRIERVTVTTKGAKGSSVGKLNPTRERIVKRAAQEFKVMVMVMMMMMMIMIMIMIMMVPLTVFFPWRMTWCGIQRL
jgi:hypothetical protein